MGVCGGLRSSDKAEMSREWIFVCRKICFGPFEQFQLKKYQ